MAEAFADDLHGDVRLQQDRGVGVSKIVETDASSGVLLDELIPHLREPVGMDWTTVG